MALHPFPHVFCHRIHPAHLLPKFWNERIWIRYIGYDSLGVAAKVGQPNSSEVGQQLTDNLINRVVPEPPPAYFSLPSRMI